MSFPSANLEVKIALPITLRGSGLSTCVRYGRILLCESVKWLQNDNQTARQEICSNMFERVHKKS
jgi:hypothetical protein